MKLIDVSALKELAENWFTKNRLYHPYAKNNNIPITELYDILEQMPSAQPEIVRCVDCVHSDTFPKGADNDMPLKCLDIRYGGVMPDWYCEHAERRTDESNV